MGDFLPQARQRAKHVPDACTSPRDHALDQAMAAIMGPGTVSVRLKELIVVRVSQVNGCTY
ncbi:MAG TPA: carboxymuconolactone decarboxylase family protein [Herpetosiphonaceae bacterium]|nr:carboxymuconolactone decarboxylase family protein [Herpetosiphonaceae bacterium]